MSPNAVEALGLLLTLAGATAVVVAAALVATALAFLVGGVLGLAAGLLLVRLANLAPTSSPKAGDTP